jgi:hypothetical protein
MHIDMHLYDIIDTLLSMITFSRSKQSVEVYCGILFCVLLVIQVV